MSRTKWCTVRVLKNGRQDWPYGYATVAGKVSGWGGITSDVETDDEGYATLEWELGDHLEKIYVSGQTFQGPFEEGRRYTLRYEV